MDSGVLLYYNYVAIPDAQEVATWFRDSCSSLRLVGRVRVANEGLNVTLGGSMASLRAHILAVSNHPLLGACDFKLDPCPPGTGRNPQVLAECRFDSLSVRIVKELVTLGSWNQSKAQLDLAGRHLSPQEFHSLLLQTLPPPGMPGCSDSATCQISERPNCRNVPLPASSSSPSSATQAPPQDFHTCPIDEPSPATEVVVVDARNVYETRIGRFTAPPGVTTLAPPIRQFSDLPAWLDANEAALRDKTVLMYCTGGVRCESASAYLRAKGEHFQKVFQLSGGIVRYMEAFPGGGFFSGKNFVFDPRLAVSSEDPTVLGQCQLCKAPHDDYTARQRCATCRMLVLICRECQVAQAAQSATGAAPIHCELCPPKNAQNPDSHTRTSHDAADARQVVAQEPDKRAMGPAREQVPAVEPPHMPEQGGVAATSTIPRLGSDMSATSAGGALLADLAELKGHVSMVPMASATCRLQADAAARCPDSEKEGAAPRLPGGQRRLRILCLHGFRQSLQSFRGRTASLQKRVRQLAEFVFIDGPHQVPPAPLYLPPGAPTLTSSLRPRYAWFVAQACQLADAENGNGASCPEEEGLSNTWPMDGSTSCGKAEARDRRQQGTSWAARAGVFHSLQYKSQVEGWKKSQVYLEHVLATQGPFDGVLGFSQGAAAAHALCILKERHALNDAGSNPDDLVLKALRGKSDFKFVILCSGFPCPTQALANSDAEFAEAMCVTRAAGRSRCLSIPSLHIFGGDEGLESQEAGNDVGTVIPVAVSEESRDRQVSREESEALAECFDAASRMVVTHNKGHMISAQREDVEKYKAFLTQFL